MRVAPLLMAGLACAAPARLVQPVPIGHCYAAVWAQTQHPGAQLPLLLILAGRDSVDSVQVRHVTMRDLREARVVEVDSAAAVLQSFWLTPRGVPLAVRHADGHFGPIASGAAGTTSAHTEISDTTPVGLITAVVGPVTVAGERWQCVGARAT